MSLKHPYFLALFSLVLIFFIVSCASEPPKESEENSFESEGVEVIEVPSNKGVKIDD